ncbi:RdgB/HAM1 family non-canonical purine NTP pyrophosphatase [Gudongella oleilytica]|jgi:XTP/dITP diphosphohydrolase|uniref:RdgB/HAM1 family non-canonical purine NTP pyrophosphatase n=1 Tax=Gudongella oleilytica TaxID=1582259 RepID=UPI000FF89CA1|nr:RdgB/HAM1 family non-canonical purine NTP pyrophosphatase [Gudongella oleilytica]
MRKLVLSTSNKNKVNEIREILKDLPVEILSKEEIGLGRLEVVEDGDTLESNSLKKARALKELTPYMVMADDSGLFVDALNGEPGIYSSRYGGDDGNDKLNNETLLRNLKDKDRTAAFRSVIALIDENGNEYVMQGICRGSLLEEEKGSGGFGYDPLFVPEGYHESFAEMSYEVKNSISHRRRAIDGLREVLAGLLGEENENTSR